MTQYIPEVIDFIQCIEQAGYAYRTPDHSVYFDTTAFGQRYRLLRAGAGNSRSRRDALRVEDAAAAVAEASEPSASSSTEEAGKRAPADFALWKGAREGFPSWESPFGAGRPGWHIECSAMATYAPLLMCVSVWNGWMWRSSDISVCGIVCPMRVGRPVARPLTFTRAVWTCASRTTPTNLHRAMRHWAKMIGFATFCILVRPARSFVRVNGVETVSWGGAHTRWEWALTCCRTRPYRGAEDVQISQKFYHHRGTKRRLWESTTAPLFTKTHVMCVM